MVLSKEDLDKFRRAGFQIYSPDSPELSELQILDKLVKRFKTKPKDRVNGKPLGMFMDENDELKIEYKGHSYDFWDRLKLFSEKDDLWSDNGQLSELGKKVYYYFV